jgi:hypothetical protein
MMGLHVGKDRQQAAASVDRCTAAMQILDQHAGYVLYKALVFNSIGLI